MATHSGSKTMHETVSTDIAFLICFDIQTSFTLEYLFTINQDINTEKVGRYSLSEANDKIVAVENDKIVFFPILVFNYYHSITIHTLNICFGVKDNSFNFIIYSYINLGFHQWTFEDAGPGQDYSHNVDHLIGRKLKLGFS